MRGGGTLGVSYFFVISGFLEAIHFNKDENTRKKLKKKALRIYIYHIPFLLFVIPFNLVNFMNNAMMKTVNFTVNLLLLQSWFPLKNVYLGFNGVAWFLSTLLFLILLRKPLILLVIRFYQKYGTSIQLCLAVLMCLGNFLLGFLFLNNGSDSSYWLYIFPPVRILEYFGGICIGRYFLQNQNLKKMKQSTVRETVLGCCFLGLLIVYPYMPYSLSRSAIYLPFALATCYVFARSEGKVSVLLSKPAITKFGGYTFYFMMSHQVIFRYLQIINNHLSGYQISGWVFVMIAFLIMIAGIRIFERYEKKTYSYLSRRLKFE